MEAEYSKQMDSMQIEGTVEYNVLHMPIRARSRFIEIIGESHPQSTIDFWRNNWINRDEKVRKLVGNNREEFLNKICPNEAEEKFWSMIWESIDQKNSLH